MKNIIAAIAFHQRGFEVAREALGAYVNLQSPRRNELGEALRLAETLLESAHGR